MRDQRKGADRKVGVPESDVATCISSFLYFFVPFSFLSFLSLCLVLLTLLQCSV